MSVRLDHSMDQRCSANQGEAALLISITMCVIFVIDCSQVNITNCTCFILVLLRDEENGGIRRKDASRFSRLARHVRWQQLRHVHGSNRKHSVQNYTYCTGVVRGEYR